MAIVKPSGALDENSWEMFPEPPSIRNQVNFWEKVFLQYSSTSVIIHDVDDPRFIVDIIDFERLAKQQGLAALPRRDQRDKIAEKYIKRYNRGLERFRLTGDSARLFAAIEKRLFEVYNRDSTAMNRLLRGQVDLRMQTGLADDFRLAVQRAQLYLPYMEKTFSSYKLPIELTRMVFVESMFNMNAKSRVGASGIWQFMPGTARKYMYITRFIDERNSPLKATKAAAQHLASAYQELNSWPLAITAYNHGIAGLQTAIRKLNTRDIGVIVRYYKSPSFKFASRNFYAEFLAARRSYNKMKNSSSPEVFIKEKLDVIPITIDKRISIGQLVKYTPLDERTIVKYNSCLLPNAFNIYRFRPLPPFYEIYIPSYLLPRVQQAIQKIKAPTYAVR